MELYDTSIDNQNKSKKIYKIIIIGIVVLVVLILLIIGLIMYLKSTIWTYELNGKTAKELKDIVIVDKNDSSKIYIPIRKMADFVGYESHRGDYIYTSEEENKCYVKMPNETVMFEENSNIVGKVLENSGEVDLDEVNYEEMNDTVVRKDGELCLTPAGILQSMYIIVSYNTDEQTLKVNTLENMYSKYEAKANSYGFETLSTNYSNIKALYENILVGESNGLYGAYDLQTGSLILENKYQDIEYISKTGDFLVTSTNGKKGVITRQKENRLNFKYDNVELITQNDKMYYCVTLNEKVGLIDIDGNIIFDIVVSSEYSKIGIDISNFATNLEENGVDNGYVLLDKLIPVEDSKGMWGFVDKSTGELVVDCQYDSIGCINDDDSKEGVLVIKSQGVIVVGNGENYDVITLKGNSVYNMALDSVYMQEEDGEYKYYLTAGSRTVDAEDNITTQIRNKNL